MFSDHPIPLSAPPSLQRKAQEQRQQEQKAAEGQAGKPAEEKLLRKIPMSEVQRHNSEGSAWIVVFGKVYDPTPFLKDHPGGAESILTDAGTDATEDFDAIHSDRARAMLEEYLIGQLAEEEEGVDGQDSLVARGRTGEDAEGGVEKTKEVVEGKEAPSTPPAVTEARGQLQQQGGVTVSKDGGIPTLVNPRQKVRVPLVGKFPISHDTYRFRFGLPSERHFLGLPVGKHIVVYAVIGEKLCARSYTPTTLDDTFGHFDLVVKVYRKLPPRFPEGGRMSQHLASLRVGDCIDIKGPTGEVVYEGKGRFVVMGREVREAKHIALLAGGTGITPMYQVIQAVVRDREDGTRMSLVYANRTPGDILFREELDELARLSDKLTVWYTVDGGEPADWPFSVGFIDAEMVRQHLPAAGPESIALVCGPPGLVNHCCVPILKGEGYPDHRILVF